MQVLHQYIIYGSQINHLFSAMTKYKSLLFHCNYKPIKLTILLYTQGFILRTTYNWTEKL